MLKEVVGLPSKVNGFVIFNREILILGSNGGAVTVGALVWPGVGNWARDRVSATALATVWASSSVVRVACLRGWVGDLGSRSGGGVGEGGNVSGHLGDLGGSPPPPNMGTLVGDGDSAGRWILLSGPVGTVSLRILVGWSSVGAVRSCRRALARLDVNSRAGLRQAAGSSVVRFDAGGSGVSGIRIWAANCCNASDWRCVSCRASSSCCSRYSTRF